MSIPQALESLRPGAEWTLIGDTLTWSDISQTEPTTAEINAEVDRLEYSRKRKAEYPDLAEQLDYIYHNGVAKWKTDIIDPVKTKYPKG